MFKRSVLLALCLLGAGASAAAASAETHREFKFAFHFDRNAAPDVTYAKLIRDARRACDPDDIRTLAATQQRDICVADIVAKAVARIDVAGLTNLHMAAGGAPARILLAQK